MGLIDQKKDVFTTIGSYSSMMESGTLPDTTNIFPSINNKKDVVPYLLDVLKVVVGSDALQELTGKLFTDLIPKMNDGLKKAIKNQNTQSNSGDKIATKHSWFFEKGIDVKIKDIDVSGKLKTSPASKAGNLIYDKSKITFDNVLYNAISNGTALFGDLLDMTYNKSTDTINFKPGPLLQNLNVGDFLNGFVDQMELINKKEFMSNVMNLFYGSITSNQNKTVEQVAQELAVMKQLQQLINDNDSFTILPEDYEAILKKAQELVNGVTYYDLGCGIMEVVYPISGMTDLISSISGSTNPFFVSNQINATIEQSTKNTPETSNANKQAIKDGFFQKLIDLIVQTLAQAITSTPQIRALLAISSAFLNMGVPQIGNPLDDLKKFRVFLKCNLNAAMALINKFIFDLVVAYLMPYLMPIIKKIIKEKINQYSKQIKDLVPGANKIKDLVPGANVATSALTG